MRKLGLLCLLATCMACNWTESKEEMTRKMVSEELSQIDWNEVDQYPLFLNCDETRSKEEQRSCFQQTMGTHFRELLEEFQFHISQEIIDTIFVDLMVDQEGKLQILEMNSNAAVHKDIPEFEGVVVRSLRSLPELQPALKRGVPVKTKFRVPIIIDTREE